MKKIVLLLAIFCLLFSIVSAQPVLTFDKHVLKADVDNPMSYCNYKDAGPSGANVTWDFSDLKFEQSFTGYLKNSMLTEIGATFPESNTELTEFDSKFYFNTDQDKIEQFGYSSVDGNIQTRYDIPFIKMKFPFSYSNYFSGTFSGATYYSGIERGTVTGTYSVEADAFGTLILPGNTVYENTLRIRTEKSYKGVLNAGSQEVDIITYRWYNEMHRYPILVLTEYTVKSGDAETTKYQAAYNNNAVSLISPVIAESILLYPNPTNSYLTLEFNAVAAGKLSYTIHDASGKIVSTFSEYITTGGIHYNDLSDKIESLIPGLYYLAIQNGEESVNRSFTLIE